MCFLAGCAVQPAAEGEENAETVAAALGTDVSVYTNVSPASPWQNWSWSTTVVLANSDAPLASGSASQIKATSKAAGGALSLAHSNADILVADYDSIEFDVRGPSSSTIRLAVQPLGGASSGV